jgi:hypothetical protein
MANVTANPLMKESISQNEYTGAAKATITKSDADTIKAVLMTQRDMRTKK